MVLGTSARNVMVRRSTVTSGGDEKGVGLSEVAFVLVGGSAKLAQGPHLRISRRDGRLREQTSPYTSINPLLLQ